MTVAPRKLLFLSGFALYAQLHQGRSDEEIMAFLKERYGDFISYRPPLNNATALLWFGPLALLLAGFFIIQRMLQGARGADSEMALNPEEQGRLRVLLDVSKDLK